MQPSVALMAKRSHLRGAAVTIATRIKEYGSGTTVQPKSSSKKTQLEAERCSASRSALRRMDSAHRFGLILRMNRMTNLHDSIGIKAATRVFSRRSLIPSCRKKELSLEAVFDRRELNGGTPAVKDRL